MILFPDDRKNIQTAGFHTWNLSYGAIGVVLLGFLARIYLFVRNPVINPDGFIYIQQAKAIYFGLYDQVLDCYNYLAPYPIFVAMLYPALGDWVIAAQWINIFFGTIVLFPLYWLLKRFLRDNSAWTALLVFALLPAYVLISRDTLRDPMFWFFSVCGLYSFILYLEGGRFLWLIWSSIFFAMGAWSRIEGSLFIIFSLVFLLFVNKKYRWKDIAVFLGPYFFFAAVGFLFANLRRWDLMELIKPERVLNLPLGFFTHYSLLREQLFLLYDTELITVSPFFLPQVRNLVWFIALGTLLVQLAETLLYLFFILLAAGMVFSTQSLKSDRRLVYLLTLSVMSLALLYGQIIYYWHLPSRFLAVFLFPAFIFLGFGIQRMTIFFSTRFRVKYNFAHIITFLIILALLLPKTLRANFSEEQLLYRQIASHIAEHKSTSCSVSVCGAFKYVRVIHFYANKDTAGAPCFKGGAILKNTGIVGLEKILIQNFDYFVWDQKGWNNKPIESLSENIKNHFIKLHEWTSDRWGKLVLYEVVK